MNQRGFVLVEFVIALPLLIFLIYSLSILTLQTAKIAREQVADYALETEAQYVIDRITTDARAAHSVNIKTYGSFDEIIFICHTDATEKNSVVLADKFNQRIYRIYSAQGKLYHVYFNHQENVTPTNPLTGENFFGNTYVTDFSFSVPVEKVLHITLELKSRLHNQKVKFSTAVYMPACKEIIYHGEKIL